MWSEGGRRGCRRRGRRGGRWGSRAGASGRPRLRHDGRGRTVGGVSVQSMSGRQGHARRYGGPRSSAGCTPWCAAIRGLARQAAMGNGARGWGRKAME